MPNTTNLTAGTVMNNSAALLNDPVLTVYTYLKQIPYLNIALQELQEEFELNNVPVTDTVSAEMTVPSGNTFIEFEPSVPDPDTDYLPDNLIEPKVLWERPFNDNPYVPMTRVDYLPRYMEGVEIPQFIFYTWQSQQIRFLPANQINQIKMDYVRDLFVTVTDPDDELGVINAKTFLEYRTAGLCAEFIGENKTRADDLNAFSSLAIDRATGIGSKGRQRINIRHRPFRASYKRRTYS